MFRLRGSLIMRAVRRSVTRKALPARDESMRPMRDPTCAHETSCNRSLAALVLLPRISYLSGFQGQQPVKWIQWKYSSTHNSSMDLI